MKVFRVVMFCDGGINIKRPLGLGDYVLRFLRDGENRKELKRLAQRFERYEVAEAENDEWVEANLDGHNVLEPLLDMLRKEEKLKVPNPNLWFDIDEYSYEIDFDQDQLCINYDNYGDHIFDLGALPSSEEIQKAVDSSRRVELDLGEFEEARSSCYMIGRSLNKMRWETEKSKDYFDKALRSLDKIGKDLEKQGIYV